MADTLKSVRDQIVTLWEALTPTSNATRTFINVDNSQDLRTNGDDGDEGDRNFWFPTEGFEAEPLHLMGNAASTYRYSFFIECRLSQFGPNESTAFDRFAEDAHQLADSINHKGSWTGADIERVQVEGITTERSDQMLLLSFQVVAEVEEP